MTQNFVGILGHLLGSIGLISLCALVVFGTICALTAMGIHLYKFIKRELRGY